MNITVYLGANEGNDPCLRKAVEELGAWIGNSGNALVYGGSKGGLMGALADSVLKAGGDVTGVEPNFFIENEFQHDGLTKLIAINISVAISPFFTFSLIFRISSFRKLSKRSSTTSSCLMTHLASSRSLLTKASTLLMTMSVVSFAICFTTSISISPVE